MMAFNIHITRLIGYVYEELIFELMQQKAKNILIALKSLLNKVIKARGLWKRKNEIEWTGKDNFFC